MTRHTRPPHAPASVENSLTRWLHRTLPQDLQLFLREKGYTRSLLNGLGAAAAALLVLSRPSVLKTFHLIRRDVSEIAYGSMPSETVQMMNIAYETERAPSNTCLLFVHGGAWGSGDPWLYAICAHNFAKALNCDLCFNVRYPLYPEANILQQRDSIIKALSFLRTLHPHHRLILAGHSSGSNICALAMLENPSLVNALILWNGVYDIHKHYLWEASRGKDDDFHS